MVFHHRNDHFVAGRHTFVGKAGSNQVDRLCRPTRENNLVGRAGVQELLHGLACILMRFRRTMLGMFIGGAIGAVFSGLMGVTYYLAGGASNFLVFTNYLQGGQMNTVWAIVGMAISFVIAAAVVFATGFSKEELAEMEA